MADYLSERLGLGVRTAQEMLRTEKALAGLPRIAAAWMSGRISAGHMRIVTRVATERTESWWLMVATHLSVAGLAAEVARWRRSPAGGADSASREGSLEGGAPEDDIDAEPERARLDVSAPAWIVVFWRQTVELVRRVAGRRLPTGSCLDVLLAEAQGTAPVWEQEAPEGPPPNPDVEEEDSAAEGQGSARTSCGTPRKQALSIIDLLARRPFEPGRVAWWQLLPVREARRDPHDLDRELRILAAGRQREEADLARRIRLAAMTRSYRSEGHRNLESWGRATLGLSPRRLYYLLALNRRLEALPALRAAFLEGRLTASQAILVGSVATGRSEAAWIERALEVTARRLDDEVSWWRHMKEVRPEVWELLRGGPPPAGLVLAPGKPPRLHASARAGDAGQSRAGGCGESIPPSLHVCELKTDLREDGGRSSEERCEVAEPTCDDLHACAHVAETIQEDDDGRDRSDGTGLHACAPLGRPPVSAAELLAALDAHEAAVPLPKRPCRITLWLEPEVLSMWKTRLAASAHESGEPMQAWEVLSLLMYNLWKTWDNQETRRQMREHKTLERDGWRCTAPGCTSMGSGILHEHHIVYRSRGGAIADPANVTTLCTAHHQGLLHGGLMRCYGEAPDGLTWELGVGDGQEPFLIYEGDRIVGGTGMES